MPETDWYFEDFEVGEIATTMGRTVTEADLVNFVTSCGIFEELFINAEAELDGAVLPGRIVPGMLILVLAEGLYVLTGHTHKGRAFLGLDELRIKAPVVCGDTIRASIAVESTRPSNSHAGHGIVTLGHRVQNQRNDEVMTYRTTRMIATRAHDAETPVPG